MLSPQYVQFCNAPTYRDDASYFQLIMFFSFGALVLGNKTGIFYNNQMDDFAYNIDPLPINCIKPEKRPLSSMVPTIIVDDAGDVRLVAGGAGSLSITTATALVNNHLSSKV